MANVVLRIETNPNASEEMLGTITNYDYADVGTNDNVSNTSIKANESGVYSGIESASGEGSNGLTWADGYLVFNEKDCVDNVDNSMGYLESEFAPTQFIWGVVPQSKGYYVKLTFSDATKLKDITIVGDSLNKQFPTRAILDGTKEVFSDDPNWAISFDNESETHTIEFTHWNRSNYNAIVSKIEILNAYLFIDKKSGLKNIESISQIKTGKNISYGIIPSSGNATIIDVSEELKDMLSLEVLPKSNLGIRVFINDSELQQHVSSNSKYDLNSKLAQFDLSNQLELLDLKQYKGIRLSYNKSALSLLNSVLKELSYSESEIDSMLNNKIVFAKNNLIGTVKDCLSKINIPFAYMKRQSFREALSKFCAITQTNMYLDGEGCIKFVSARPIATEEETRMAYKIPKSYCSGVFIEDVVVNNKYDGFKIMTNKLIENTNVEKYSSKQIFAYDDNDVYIGANESINSSIYEIEHAIDYEVPYQQISYSFDLDDIDSIYEINDDNFMIEITANRRLYTRFPNKTEYEESGVDSHTYLLDSESSLFGGYIYIKNTFLDNLPEFELSKQYGYDEFVKYQGKVYATTKKTLAGNPPIGTLPTDTTYWEEKVKNRLYVSFPVRIYYGSSATPLTNSAYRAFVSSYTFRVYAKSGFSEEYVDSVKEGESTIDLMANHLLQTGTTIDGQPLAEVIGQSIIDDYYNGVHFASVTTFCGNFYSETGEKIIDWDNGQIVRPNDIVYFEDTSTSNSNRLWRVVGRTFRKTGVPIVDLELQEIVKIY